MGEPLVQIVLVDVTEEEHRALEQRAYAAHLVTVQEDERRHLAQDLHDDPVQLLIHHTRMLKQLSDDPRLASEFVPLVRQGGLLAAQVGGSLEIRANAPHGTLVRATLQSAARVTAPADGRAYS